MNTIYILIVLGFRTLYYTYMVFSPWTSKDPGFDENQRWESTILTSDARSQIFQTKQNIYIRFNKLMGPLLFVLVFKIFYFYDPIVLCVFFNMFLCLNVFTKLMILYFFFFYYYSEQHAFF